MRPQGPDSELQKTANAQPAIMITSLAAAEKWRILAPKENARLRAVAGFSLGEFSALVFSGAISFDDGVRLVKARAEAMQACAERHSGGMASVAGMEDAALAELCAEALPGNPNSNSNLKLGPFLNLAYRGDRRALRRGSW